MSSWSMHMQKYRLAYLHPHEVNQPCIVKDGYSFPKDDHFVYSGNMIIVKKEKEKRMQSRTSKWMMKYLPTPFVDNFISPPLHEVAKLGTSGQNYATEFSNYLYKVLAVPFQV